MKISQIELFSVVAIILYIVFFAHSPPYMLRHALGNVFVAGTVFAVLTYITLYHNQTIGVMLILAFLMTMTQVTEHLTGDGPSSTQQDGASGRRPREPAAEPPAPTNIPVPPTPPSYSTSNGRTMDPQTPSCPPGYNYSGGSNTCRPTGGGDFICPSGNTKYTGRNGEKGCIPNDRVEAGVSSGQITVDNSSAPAPTPAATPAATAPPTAPKAAAPASAAAPATPPPAAAAPAPVMSCNIESFAPF